MMPWTIIGWLLLIMLALGMLSALGIVVFAWLATMIPYWRTRNDQPLPGDVWMQGASPIYITNVWPPGSRSELSGADISGRILMESRMGMSRAMWSDSPKEWRERVRNRKLYRVSTRKLKAVA